MLCIVLWQEKTRSDCSIFDFSSIAILIKENVKKKRRYSERWLSSGEEEAY